MYKKLHKRGMRKPHIRQILLIMRLTTVLLLGFILQVSASGYAQKLTLRAKNEPLSKIFTEIRKQSGYDFVFTNSTLNDAKPVSITVKEADINEVLERIFKGQPLEYKVKDRSVVVSKKEIGFLDKMIARFQAIDIRARVTDEKGMPLPGASVRVKNTNLAAVTDANGLFYLKGVAEDAILVISFIGYNQKEVKAAADMGLIRLEAATSKLDEVQVMAYGTTSRRLSTSNIFSVKAADIEKQPVTNPLLALQGRVPGLDIVQSTGYANTGVTVRIQGQNSLRKGSDPLYVIDGVPYPSQMLAGANAMLGTSDNIQATSQDGTGGTGNPLSFINPASIESIEILKDADATAIYGSRAASGAILITTKKGKVGATKVDASVQSGGGQVSNKLKLLNTEQYLVMRKEAFQNNGVAVPTSTTTPINYNYDLTVWDQKRYTDWQEELIGGIARYTDAQTTISGGSSSTQFLVGAGYHKETTVFPTDMGNTKGSVNFSLNNVSVNQKFRVQLTGSYMNDMNKLPGKELTDVALKMPPNAPALYNADGSLNWAPLPNGKSTWNNPLAFFKWDYSVKTNNLVGNALLSYQLIPGLDLKSVFGYTNLTTNEFSGQPLSAYAPETHGVTNNNSAVFVDTRLSSTIIEPQLTYKRSLFKGTLDILLGGTMQQNKTDLLVVSASKFSSDLLLHNLESATQQGLLMSTSAMYKYNAAFGRIAYNYRDKYLVTLTGRRDGSSRFGPENRFHNFGSVAGAWIFSAEEVIKRSLPFLSFGKLLASYGSTGNDQIGDYNYLSRYESLSVPVSYQGIGALVPSGISDPAITWEETRKLQGGVDLGFVNDRVLLNVKYYRNRSSSQLLQYNLPYVTGFNSIGVTNFPATVQNYGWEFMVNTINIKSENFNWSTNINLSSPKNKLIRFDNLENSAYALELAVGKPVYILSKYQYLGVDPSTGLYQVADKNGNPTTTPNIRTDRIFVDNSPGIRGGFQNSFSYKGMQLDVMFQFAKQTGGGYRGYRPGFFYSTIDYGGSISGGNQPANVLDRWQKAGDFSQYQKFSTYTFPTGTSGREVRAAYDRADQSTLSFVDASYIRLKNVSLSLNFPQDWIKLIHLTNAKLFVQGQNLLTFTKYNGLDPEQPFGETSLPSLRVLTFGIKVGL